jgi:SAM-dependent methyltransferase
MKNYLVQNDGTYRPSVPVEHRDDEYDQEAFDTLCEMQERHFWYRGRHRFLIRALDRQLPHDLSRMSAIDLGGGVGGWLRDLSRARPQLFARLALADSSLVALTKAKSLLPATVERYQVDLMRLEMQSEWDVAFMLDVIEHLPDDLEAIIQVKESLKPGGRLFITAPAFPVFWSYNDDLAHHLRRYRRSDFLRLAREAGLKLNDSRYFMFLLSPLYLLSRIRPGFNKLSRKEQKTLVLKQHETPPIAINRMLTGIFASETPLGHWIRFPWGTSILGVFERS